MVETDGTRGLQGNACAEQAVRCFRSVRMSRVPLVVILGATGTGKSQLAIELARRFSGEIISADSMQVYKGLDISMAKVTEEEKNLVRHYMMDIVNPMLDFTVHDFRNMVLPIMDDMRARKKIPIIVGGTNYYIESILWKVLITNPYANEEDNKDSSCVEDPISDKKKLQLKYALEELEDEVLYKRLCEVDPDRAQELHPNNRRRIIRSLEVFDLYGVKHSELLKTQREAGGSFLGGSLRFPDFLLFWLNCEKDVLMNRLDRRVDSMVKSGLVQELLDFHRIHSEPRIKDGVMPDYTKGIFQNIGLKEFHEYLVLPEIERNSEKGENLMKKALEDMKLHTRQYAKRQLSWIRNRLVKRADREVPPIYSLDCTNVDEWKEKVSEPASLILSSVLRGEQPDQVPVNAEYQKNRSTERSSIKCYHCEICNLTCVGDHQWAEHLSGRKHMYSRRRKERLQQKDDSVVS